MKVLSKTFGSLVAGALLLAAPAAAETVMFGGDASRNMASAEKGLPEKWNPETGENIKWVVSLGSQSYSGPLVAGGKVFVGTNNDSVKNPKITGDRGVLMAFSTADGKLLWQAARAKLSAGRVNDWPFQGICSTPAVEGDRIYYVSNRGELVASDTEGFLDQENDGPFQDETDKGPTDEDVVWKLDMINELGVYPHNMSASSPLIVGDAVYIVTANGVDEGHINIPAPEAPSFIAVDKKTGKLLWASSLPGTKIMHGQWSSPSYGVIKGRPQVIFAGGDGWIYSFEPATGKLLWKFDCNPKDSVYRIGAGSTRNNVIAMPVIWDDKVYVGVGEDPEHGEGIGHLWAIDATMEGDVTGKAGIWHRDGEDFHRTLSTVAIADGIVYASDLSGYLYALDAKTGEHYWTYNAYAAIWGSPRVADGKIYLGDEDGDVAVLRTGKKLEVIGVINMGGAVYTTVAARDGVLYISSRNKLWAIEKGAHLKPSATGGAPSSPGAGEKTPATKPPL
ncbi:MAG TPA: PQQ-binding-like beta-propeller repeat protein [Thermoanaerobaculia bacterium]|jgi:outer membrane protein assembly factor BamB